MRQIRFFLLMVIVLCASQNIASAAEPPLWDLSRSRPLLWDSNSGKEMQNYTLKHKIGLSGLAYEASGEQLLMVCEKYPRLIQLQLNPKEPLRLLDLKFPTWDDVEAISLCEGTVYLCDEDELKLYTFSLNNPEIQQTISLVSLGIDASTVNGNAADKSSLEGLVVTQNWLGSGKSPRQQTDSPFLYLLDEHDIKSGQSTATLYITQRQDQKIVSVRPPVSFPLKDTHERLTELFLYNQQLYAIRSYYVQGDLSRSNYEIVRCDLEQRTLTPVLNFLPLAREMERQGISSNFEGATVDSAGTLYLASDNESEQTRQGKHPQPATRGSALIAIPRK